MPRYAKSWTQDDDDILKRAVLDGWPLRDMCERLDRTKAAVRARAHVLGLSFRLIRPNSKIATR